MSRTPSKSTIALFERMLPAAAHAVVAFLTGARVADPDERTKPDTVRLSVTPQLALWLLEANVGNRNIRINDVGKIIHDIKHGNWKLNGETIKFDWFGRLLDGQHRLWAIAESGTPVEVDVAFNVDPEAADTMNQGVPDTISDFARRREGVAYAEKIASWARVWYSLNGNFHVKLTNNQFKEWREAHQVEIAWAIATFLEGQKPCTANTAPVVGALMFAHQTNPSKITEFAKPLVTGTNIPSNTTIHTLHDYLYKTLPVRRDRGFIVSKKVLQAAYLFVKGKFANKLYESDTALEYFAKPHGGLQPLSTQTFELLTKLTAKKRSNPINK